MHTHTPTGTHNTSSHKETWRDRERHRSECLCPANTALCFCVVCGVLLCRLIVPTARTVVSVSEKQVLSAIVLIGPDYSIGSVWVSYATLGQANYTSQQCSVATKGCMQCHTVRRCVQ